MGISRHEVRDTALPLIGKGQRMGRISCSDHGVGWQHAAPPPRAEHQGGQICRWHRIAERLEKVWEFQFPIQAQLGRRGSKIHFCQCEIMHTEKCIFNWLYPLLGSDFNLTDWKNILLFIRKITSPSILSAGWVLRTLCATPAANTSWILQGASWQQNWTSPLVFTSIRSPWHIPAAYLKPCLKSDFSWRSYSKHTSFKQQ